MPAAKPLEFRRRALDMFGSGEPVARVVRDLRISTSPSSSSQEAGHRPWAAADPWAATGDYASTATCVYRPTHRPRTRDHRSCHSYLP